MISKEKISQKFHKARTKPLPLFLRQLPKEWPNICWEPNLTSFNLELFVLGSMPSNLPWELVSEDDQVLRDPETPAWELPEITKVIDKVCFVQSAFRVAPCYFIEASISAKCSSLTYLKKMIWIHDNVRTAYTTGECHCIAETSNLLFFIYCLHEKYEVGKDERDLLFTHEAHSKCCQTWWVMGHVTWKVDLAR